MSTTSKPNTQRARGRPGPSARADVREQILAASERLFALQGFSATTVREIADAVDVNPAMVHYYFGSKDALLKAVMASVFEPLTGSMESLQKSGTFNLEEFTALFYSVMGDHPHLPQLITREVFLPGGKLQQHFLEKFAPRLGGRLPGILAQQQKLGRLDPELDTQITSLMILALCIFPFIAKPAAEQGLGVKFDAEGMRRMAQHITRILEKGIMS